MKKLFFVPLMMISVLAYSQQIMLTNTTPEVIGSIDVAEDSEVEAHIDVVNTTDEDIVVRARRTVITHVEPWNDPFNPSNDGFLERFCWGPICYDYGTEESSTSASLLVTIPAGETNTTFVGYYEHEGVAGVTQIEYCFFDNADPQVEACQEVLFCIDAECVVSVEELDFELGEIAPNPFAERASFTYRIPALVSRSEIVIYNMVGDLVKTIPLNNSRGTVFIDVEGMVSGVYFYALLADGAVLTTKKFVVSK